MTVDLGVDLLVDLILQIAGGDIFIIKHGFVVMGGTQSVSILINKEDDRATMLVTPATVVLSVLSYLGYSRGVVL